MEIETRVVGSIDLNELEPEVEKLFLLLKVREPNKHYWHEEIVRRLRAIRHISRALEPAETER